MSKSLQECLNRMRELVESPVDIKAQLLETLNSLDDNAGELPSDKTLETISKQLFPNKPFGPFTFVFEMIDYRNANDETGKHKFQDYTVENLDFPEACRRAVIWQEDLYLDHNVVLFDDIK